MTVPAPQKKWPVYLLHAGVFLSVLGIYHVGLARGLVEIDAGELAAVQCSNGIAHPTGYGLYTFLGFLWSKLPFFPSVIYGLNFFAAVCVALSANVVLAGVARMLTDVLPEGFYRNATAATVALCYAFFGLVWAQAVSVEVYSFLLLCLAAVLYAVIAVDQNPGSAKLPYWLGLLLGLAVGHHLLALFAVPAVFVFVAGKYGRRCLLPLAKVFGAMAACLLLQYLWLFLHASASPELNWGNPSTFSGLWRHITGAQYRQSMLVSAPYADTLSAFLGGLPHGTGYVALPLALAGIVYGFKRHMWLNVAFLLLAFCTVFLTPLYAIRDINNYFLPFYLPIPYWVGLGLTGLMRWRRFVLYPFFLLPLVPVVLNAKVVDRSRHGYIDAYTALFFEKMPQNALYVGYAWDILISPTYYCQYCEQTRRDVHVVEKFSLSYSWYYHQLDPTLFAGMEAEKEAWTQKLRASEYDPAKGAYLQAELSRFFTRWLAVNMERRPVVLSFEIFKNNLGKDVVLPPGTIPVPMAFGYRLYPPGTPYVPLDAYREPLVDFGGRDDFYTRLITEDRANLWIARCLYEMQYGMRKNADLCVSVLRERYPGHSGAQKLFRMLGR